MPLVRETVIMVEVVTAEHESRAHSEAGPPVLRAPSRWIGRIWIWIGVGRIGPVRIGRIGPVRIGRIDPVRIIGWIRRRHADTDPDLDARLRRRSAKPGDRDDRGKPEAQHSITPRQSGIHVPISSNWWRLRRRRAVAGPAAAPAALTKLLRRMWVPIIPSVSSEGPRRSHGSDAPRGRCRGPMEAYALRSASAQRKAPPARAGPVRGRPSLALFLTTNCALQFGRPLFQLSPELFKFGNRARIVDGSCQAEALLRLFAQIFLSRYRHESDTQP